MSRATIVPNSEGRRGSRPVESLLSKLGASPEVEEFLEGAAAPLAAGLLAEPSQREVSAVQQALDWWLDSLPSLGIHLAPELKAPGDALLKAFSRGRFVTLAKGERLLAEGEEVRHYAIVLIGRCRLRCRAPAPKTGAPARGSKAVKDDGTGADDEEDGLAAALDEDGLVHVGYVGRGEAIGLQPGEPRAPWEAVCTERTAVLLLGAEDYSVSLRPFHRTLSAETVQFLQDRGVCPQASPATLHRFSSMLRHRRVRRGTVLCTAGEIQRNIYILKEGSCSLLSPPQEKQVGEVEGEEDELEEEEAEKLAKDEAAEQQTQRRDRLRNYSMQGAAMQHEGAANEARNGVLKKHARGNLGKILRGEKNAKPHSSLGVTARKDGLVPTAVVSEPGSVIGEEVLLYDTFRELVVARNCYSAIANEDCLLLAVDITAFQKLGSYVGSDYVLEKTKQKLSRHLSQHTHCRMSAMQMTKDIRRTKRRELHKQERQTLRLPPSYAGAIPQEALESTDDWLTTVLNYRKAPKNDKCPGTLNCLNTLALDPLTFQSGPGVGAMLQVFNNPGELQTLRDGLRYRKIGGRRLDADRNPMGETIQKEARYAETAPPNALGSQQAFSAPEAVEEADGGMGGLFFCTEVDEATFPMGSPTPPPAVRASAPSGESPPASGTVTKRSTSSASPQAIARSSSVPVLPRLSGNAATGAVPEAPSGLTDARRTLSRSNGSAGVGASSSRKSGGSTRDAMIAKTFFRSIVGKSILVLTDKADSRKAIMRGLQTALTEFELVFVKTSADLWTRLHIAKETYHALLVDLDKTDFQADPLLKSVRSSQRYGRLPILVLSSERELSETVRSSCSFVVFHPVAASMLREGLLWCLDKKALKGGKPEAVDTAERGRSAGIDGAKAMLSLTATAVPMLAVN